MQRIYCNWPALVLLALTIASCGGNGGGLIEGPAVPAPVIGEAVVEGSELPAFSELDGIERDISRAGGGWQELPVTGPGVIDMSSSATPGLDGLLLEAADDPAWFAWGISGIGDGLFIDALYLDLRDADSEYFIAVSDYASGRWLTLGPFSGSEELSFPEPTDYISETGNHYIAVIVPEGSQTVEACSIRVGGDDGDAPLPVNPVPDISGRAVFLEWWHSPSYSELDFTGYLVARAGYFDEQYELLFNEPVMQTQYVDETAEQNVWYRYIVYSCDAAGNRTPSPVTGSYANGVSDNPPVVVVDYTPGPLVYPANVRVDLSGSYDPDGDPIEEYRVSIQGTEIDFTQTDPVFDLTLPAGGYRVDVRVANDKYSYSWFPMTVLPAWEDESRVLIESSNTFRRAWMPRLATDPVSGRQVAIYIDTMRSAVIASWITQDGLEEFGNWPLYSQEKPGTTGVYRYISEPVVFNDRLLVLVKSGSQRKALQLDATGFRTAGYFSTGGSGEFQSDIAVDDEGSLWNFVVQGVGFDIYAYPSGGFSQIDVHENVSAPGLLDAEYNPASGNFELVYTDGGSLMWAVVDPLAAESSRTSIATTDVLGLDLEYNPHTETMEVLIGSSTGLFHARRGALAAGWGGFMPVDNSAAARGSVDLTTDAQGSYAFAAVVGGHSRIYIDSGSGWAAGQETAWADGGYEVSALRLPDGQNLLMDRSLGSIHVLQMGDQFGQQELGQVEGTDYLGLGLTVEDNADGIYLATRRGLGLSVLGSVTGQAWDEYVSGMGILPEGIRLSTDAEGSPYLSYIFNGQVRQYRYNGSSFDLINSYLHNEDTMPIVGGSHDSLFMLDQSAQLGDGSVVYQIDGNEFDREYVNGPVRDGVLDGYSTNSFSGLVLYGGSSGFNGAIGYLTNSRQEIRYVSYWGGMPHSDPLIVGRTMDSAYGYFPGQHVSGGIYYAVSSDTGHPIRVGRRDSSFHAEQIPVGVSDRDEGEMRRIVSADNTPMFGGVAIISNLQGEVELFEMSTQSRFFPLEFPDIEHGHMYEIVAAQDGRWHIIYRDMVTDDLMIRSTINPTF